MCTCIFVCSVWCMQTVLIASYVFRIIEIRNHTANPSNHYWTQNHWLSWVKLSVPAGRSGIYIASCGTSRAVLGSAELDGVTVFCDEAHE